MSFSASHTPPARHRARKALSPERPSRPKGFLARKALAPERPSRPKGPRALKPLAPSRTLDFAPLSPALALSRRRSKRARRSEWPRCARLWAQRLSRRTQRQRRPSRGATRCAASSRTCPSCGTCVSADVSALPACQYPTL
eukprot:993559-Pleurochrysis_carterae.AAC.2